MKKFVLLIHLAVHTLRPARCLCSNEEMPWQTRVPCYQSLPWPDPQQSLSRSRHCHLLVKMFPLRCSSGSLRQQLHPQPQFLTSEGKFMPIPFSTYELRTKMRHVQVQKHFWPSVRHLSYAFAFP